MADLQTTAGALSAALRPSSHINRKPAAHLLNAINLARRLGRPLNQFVTINFDHTACPAKLVSRQFKRLRDNYFSPWLRRNGVGPIAPPTFVWSVENDGACAVHWLVHIPKGRVGDFRKRLHDWLASVAGEIRCSQAIHVRYAPAPPGAGKYMLKGINPAWAQPYGIRHISQGIVHGKRSGFSRCLGPTTRRRLQDAGLVPRLRRLTHGTATVPPV